MPFSIDTTIHSDYNKYDSMSLYYNRDNIKIMIDDHRPMSVESQMMSDSVCPTNSIGSTNKSKEYFPTQQIRSHQIIHNEEKLHKGFTHKDAFKRYQRQTYW